MFSDLISQPRVIFGRIEGSALIRSRVCIMASTLWIPYCSRTAPHFLSWTLTKCNTAGLLTFITYGENERTHTHEHTQVTCTLSAGGWWWTENRAPMMMSPGICANTLLSLFWALTPTWCFRPSQLRSAPSNTLAANRLTYSPNLLPIPVFLLTPPAILCPLTAQVQMTVWSLAWCLQCRGEGLDSCRKGED